MLEILVGAFLVVGVLGAAVQFYARLFRSVLGLFGIGSERDPAEDWPDHGRRGGDPGFARVPPDPVGMEPPPADWHRGPGDDP